MKIKGLKITLALILCMFMVQYAGTEASAAAPTKSVYITLEDGTLESVTDVLTDSSGTGWMWNSSTGELMLNNFSGRSIQADGELNIVLGGTNTINMPVDCEVAGLSTTGWDRITIGGPGSLAISGSAEKTHAYGMRCSGVTLKDSASVSVNITGAKEGFVIGINATDGYLLKMYDTASVDVSVKAEDGNAFALLGGLDLYGTGRGTFRAESAKGEATGISSDLDTNCDEGSNITVSAKGPLVHDALSLRTITGSGTEITVENGTVYGGRSPLTIPHTTVIKSMDGEKLFWKSVYDERHKLENYVLSYASTGEKAENGVKLMSDQTPEAFEFIDDPCWDLPEGVVGTEMPGDYYGTRHLAGGVKGTGCDYEYAGSYGYEFQVIEGSLPPGISLGQEGEIRGTYTASCPAGEITVKVYRTLYYKYGKYNIDNTAEPAVFKISYGQVKDPPKYMTVDGSRFEMHENHSGSGWNYVYEGGIDGFNLQLNNYTGGRIESEIPFTLTLTGESVIVIPENAGTAAVSAGHGAGAALTVRGSGRLTVTGRATGSSSICGVEAMGVDMYDSASIVIDVSAEGTGNAVALEMSGGYGLDTFDSASLNLNARAKMRAMAVNGSFSPGGTGSASFRAESSEDTGWAVGQIRAADTGASHIRVSASGPDAETRAAGIYHLGAHRLTVEKGKILGLENEIPFQKSDDTAVRLKSGEKTFWKAVYENNYWYHYLCRVSTGETVTDGAEILPGQTPGEFGFTDHPCWDIPEGKMGSKMSESQYGERYLAGGVSGTAYPLLKFRSRDGEFGFRFALESGTLPKGLTLSEKGVISGTYEEPCPAGEVTVRVERTVYNKAEGEYYKDETIAPVYFVLNYGNVFSARPLTAVRIEQEDMTVLAGEQAALRAYTEPEDADYKAIKWSCDNSDAYIYNKADGSCTVSMNKAGKVTVRAESAEVSSVYDMCVITFMEEAPSVTVDFRQEKINGLGEFTYKAETQGESMDIAAEQAPDLSIPENWFGKTVTFSRTDAEGNITGFGKALEIPARPAAPSVTGGKGYIGNMDETMEYIEADGTSEVWSNVASDRAYVPRGTYKVRVEATDSSFRGAEAEVTVLKPEKFAGISRSGSSISAELHPDVSAGSTFIAAGYDREGRMIAIGSCTVTETQEGQAITVSGSGFENAYEIKGFMVNGELAPLYGAVILP